MNLDKLVLACNICQGIDGAQLRKLARRRCYCEGGWQRFLVLPIRPAFRGRRWLPSLALTNSPECPRAWVLLPEPLRDLHPTGWAKVHALCHVLKRYDTEWHVRAMGEEFAVTEVLHLISPEQQDLDTFTDRVIGDLEMSKKTA